jgi:hypothetical protein
MSEIIECPQCHRKLRMDESAVGQTVQCPACQNIFVAQAQAPPPPPTPPMPTPYRAVERPEPRRDDDYPRRREDDYDRRRVPDDEDYPRPRRPRDGYGYGGAQPHRGSTIQTLGILALVFCWMPIACLILGICAISMASTDLDLMRRGLMDRSGESATNTGKTCGIIGLCLTAGFVLCCCVGNLGGRR